MESKASADVSQDHWLVQIALSAWQQSQADFYHPPLPDPEVEYLPEAASYFYIDSKSWKVHLNTAGVPLHMDSNEAIPYLRSVCHHEIQHYLLCPFDGVTNGLMFSAARKKVNDATAMFVCNLFADLVVDSKLLKQFPSLTHSRINSSIHESAIRESEHSMLWSLIVSSYRAMWGFPIPPLVTIEQSISDAATKITGVARKSIDNEKRWPKACEKIAEIVANLLPEDELEQLLGCGGFSNKEMESESVEGPIIIKVPLDVDIVMGSPIETRNGDLARKCLEKQSSSDLEAEMEDLAIEVEQRGGDLKDLESVYLTAGYGDPKESWVRFWYRAKAKGLIRFDVSEKKFSGLAPLSPQVWRLGDPIEELDIVQSLQAFPLLIPNLSTRKWLKVSSEGTTQSSSLPDMLLVIDSSGSMTWNMTSTTIRGPYHTALVAAFAAMDVVLRRGSRVAAINFSSGSKSSEWSTSKSVVEQVLLNYQGGGTVAPVKKIAKVCDEAESQVMVLMITDAEIANWDTFVETVYYLSTRGHRIFLFHIGGKGGKKSMTHVALEDAGAIVYPIKSIKDLPGLVIREVRNIYGI